MPKNSPSNGLYLRSQILKLSDLTKLQNFLFAYDHYHQQLPTSLQNTFCLVKHVHNYNTKNYNYKLLNIPEFKTKKYGKYSIKYQSTKCYNMLMRKFHRFVNTF